MLGTTHKLLGAATGMVVMQVTGISPINSPVPYVGFVGMALLGSLLPDADQPNSTIGKELYLVWLPLYIVRGLIRVFALIIPGLKAVSKVMAHRGIAHTPVFWATIGALAYLHPFIREHYFYAGALLLGVGTHLVSDMVFGGIPVYFPFSTKKISPGIKLKTGGYLEFMVSGICITGIMFLIYLPAIQFLKG